jgi:DNA-binding transcriptional MerR regulator
LQVTEVEFDLKELCERAGVTPRTVHFYVQQGLLRPAGTPGPGARYAEGHVWRLKLIRLLQKQHLPLAEIAKRIGGLSDEQVKALLQESRQRRASEAKSALEYIRGVLADQRVPSTLRKLQGQDTRLQSPPRAQFAIPPASPEPVRSQWERFTLIERIELHVRRPLSRTQQRQLDRLLAAARDIFGPEEEE